MQQVGWLVAAAINSSTARFEQHLTALLILSRGCCLIDVCQHLSNSCQTTGGEREATCPHICHWPSVPWEAIDPYRTLCSYAQQTSKQHRRLALLSDSVSARVSNKGGRRNPAAVTPPAEGKSNETATTSQAGNTLHLLVSRASEDARDQYSFSAAGCVCV